MKRKIKKLIAYILIVSIAMIGIQLSKNTVNAAEVKKNDTTAPVFHNVCDFTVIKGYKFDSSKNAYDLFQVWAKDNVDGEIITGISYSKFSTNKVGTQTITYTVKDKAGNKATATAKLHVKANGMTVYCMLSKINVYKNASSKSPKIGTLAFGKTAEIIKIDMDSSLVKIELSNGKIGYCNSYYLTTGYPEKKSKASDIKINKDKCRFSKNGSILIEKDEKPMPPADMPEGNGW
jgi:hypothetical protein